MIDIAIMAVLSYAILGNATADTPHIFPDSPIYGVKIFFEEVPTWFMFDPNTKLTEIMREANERIQETDVMVKQNKLDKANISLTNFYKKLDQALVIYNQQPNAKLWLTIQINNDVTILNKESTLYSSQLGYLQNQMVVGTIGNSNDAIHINATNTQAKINYYNIAINGIQLKMFKVLS